MKIQCKSSDGKKLSNKCQELGFTVNSDFDITLDREYVVYGVCIWRNVILYLISDDIDNPNWYPAELFSVIDSKISDGWSFTTYDDGEYDVEATLGYPQLLDKSHYVKLIERESEALKIFFQEKSRMDLA